MRYQSKGISEIFFWIAAMAALLAWAAGCSDGGMVAVSDPEGYDPAAVAREEADLVQDSFKTETIENVEDEEKKVDLLVVVDDSGSMGNEQETLAAAVSDFVAALQLEKVDYQVAVTTTDMRFDGALKEIAGEKIFTPATADVEATLEDLMRVGTSGSGTERGLDAAVAALSRAVVGGDAEGFLREEAMLAVLILSDEEDDSVETVETLVGFIQGFKADPDNVSISAFVKAPGDTSCTTAYEESHRYPLAVEMTNGVLGSICDTDYRATLERFVTKIADFDICYQLKFNNAMFETLRVWRNDVEISGFTTEEQDGEKFVCGVGDAGTYKIEYQTEIGEH